MDNYESYDFDAICYSTVILSDYDQNWSDFDDRRITVASKEERKEQKFFMLGDHLVHC